MRRAPTLAAWALATAFAPMAAQAQAEPRFDILEYEITGNSVLADAVVEAAVLPFLGEGRTLADAEAARAALEKAYQGAGYLTVLVDIPEQRVDSGVIVLRVIEGRVERLRVTGSRYVDQGLIRDRVHEATPGRVPDFNALQAQIATLTREERQIQPLLRPGIAPGTVEVELRVTDQLPLSATLELNDRHAAQTEPLRAQATVRYDNLFQRDHSLAATYITAPQAPQQSKVLALNYTAPLGTHHSLLASLVLSDSTVEPLGAVTVVGKGTSFGLRWLTTVATPGSVHTLGAGLEYKDQRERTEDASGTLSTPLRYLPLQASYSGVWFAERGQTSLSATLGAGLRSLLQRDIECPGNVGLVDQFACRREGADGSFSTLRLDLRHSQPAPGGLPGTLALRLAGQLATQPLVSAEQFAIGGAETVRGYYESEASGDHGLLGSVEWRSANLWPAAGGEGGGIDSLSALGFVDVARIQLLQPAAGQPSRVPLAGAGFGLRLRAARRLTAELDLAWPLKATPATATGEPRVHARVQAAF